MDMDSVALDNFYPGLTAVSTKQIVAKMAMITASANEIVLIECENESDVSAVQAILQARKQAQVDGGALVSRNDCSVGRGPDMRER